MLALFLLAEPFDLPDYSIGQIFCHLPVFQNHSLCFYHTLLSTLPNLLNLYVKSHQFDRFEILFWTLSQKLVVVDL